MQGNRYSLVGNQPASQTELDFWFSPSVKQRQNPCSAPPPPPPVYFVHWPIRLKRNSKRIPDAGDTSEPQGTQMLAKKKEIQQQTKEKNVGLLSIEYCISGNSF